MHDERSAPHRSPSIRKNLYKIRRELQTQLTPIRFADWSEIVDYGIEYRDTIDESHADAADFLIRRDPSLTPTDRAALQRLIEHARQGTD